MGSSEAWIPEPDYLEGWIWQEGQYALSWALLSWPSLHATKELCLLGAVPFIMSRKKQGVWVHRALINSWALFPL